MPSPVELPRHPVVHGHPIHAMLSDLPVVLIPAALALEVARRISGGRSGSTPAGGDLTKVAAAGALASATAAGVSGWIDWLTMPTEHPAQKPATLHGVVNTAALLALVGAVALPGRRLPFLTFATAAVMVGGWIGGELVFHHGWRVRPAEEAEIVEQRLAKSGATRHFEEARQEVSSFERRKTFFGR